MDDDLKTKEQFEVSNDVKDEWLNSRKRIYKNLIAIGFAWIFLFTSYSSLANLQSSLNKTDGLGTASLATIYVALIVSSLFIPPTMIKNLGLKYTIMISQLGYILYMVANIYARWWTLIPTAIVLGLAAAPLWTAKCAYLTEIGGYYSQLSGETSEAVVNRFFGIFFAMFQSSNVFGNIISSAILNSGEQKTQVFNYSLCGARCLKEEATNHTGTDEDDGPAMYIVYTLCGVYITVALLSILTLWLFLDKYKRKQDPNEGALSIRLLITTLKHLKNKYQLLIIPLTLWSGFEQAFLSADFTKYYVTCSKGIGYVGYVMISYGVSDTIGSYGFGFVVKYIGRIPCFLIAGAINYALIITMMFWYPNAESTYGLFLIAIFWGLGDSVWQTQINSFYGVLFKDNKEAAFSNYRLWESVGFAVAYAYSNYLCVTVKLYLLLVYLSLGMLGYLLIEFMEYVNKKVKINNLKV